jgi:hypothetical protein
LLRDVPIGAPLRSFEGPLCRASPATPLTARDVSSLYCFVASSSRITRLTVDLKLVTQAMRDGRQEGAEVERVQRRGGRHDGG